LWYVLWSPWRMKYILKASKGFEGCIFCKAALGDERENWVVYKSKYSLIMLNIYPYNTGHVMVAPKRHVPRPDLLTDEEALDLHKSTVIALKALDLEYKPHGYNVGLNLGRIAGAGVEEHMHIHIVPRWQGDTNYMPVVGQTKVLPEDLNQTYERLKKAILKVLSSGIR